MVFSVVRVLRLCRPCGDQLLSAGVNGVSADMLTDSALDAPATDGLAILKPDTPLHFIVYGGGAVGILDITGKWLGEVSLDTPIHQLRVDLSTGMDWQGLHFGLQGMCIAQLHDSTFDGEYRWSSSIGKTVVAWN